MVGGDFFDWFPTPSGSAIALADVMGKGMGGAILMATVRAVLRVAAGQPSLAAGVNYASIALEDDLSQTDSFFTLFIARAKGDEGDVQYVDAGHGLAIIVRADGTMERLDTRGLPVGMLTETEWDDSTFRLETGDSLIVCSDGILDVRGGADTAEDVDRVLREVAAVALELGDAQAIVDKLTDVSGDQPDDVTVLVLRRL
jgi:serine phosphatase RsbU (regulator of sigma subunit)